MTYEKISNARIALIIPAGVFIFVLFALDGQDGRGVIGALSICAILAVLTIVKEIARGPKFWVVVAAILLAHILLVFLPPWAEMHFPLIALAPLVIADMYACARMLIFAGATRP